MCHLTELTLGAGMLQRGIFEGLPLWPFIVWPVLATTLLYTMFAFNRGLAAQGITAYGGKTASFMGGWYAIASIFDTTMHCYNFYVFGWKYVVFMPVTALLTTAFQLLGFVPFGHYLGPFAYTAISAAYLVLLGIVPFEPLARVNYWALRLLELG